MFASPQSRFFTTMISTTEKGISRWEANLLDEFPPDKKTKHNKNSPLSSSVLKCHNGDIQAVSLS